MKPLLHLDFPIDLVCRRKDDDPQDDPVISDKAGTTDLRGVGSFSNICLNTHIFQNAVANILYASIYMTNAFGKTQNYRDGKQISGFQGLRAEGRLDHKDTRESWGLHTESSHTLVRAVVTWVYAFAKTH